MRPASDVSTEPAVPAASPGPSRWLVAGVATVIGLLAFGLRLGPVLAGGGLFGQGNYDDAVHYAASVALLEGRLPYRDFLFLHPPGIVLLLVPFGLLGGLLGDPVGLAIARVSWMLLGAVNALLVGVVLRRVGWAAALLGSLAYALSYAAVYGEHSVLLEAPPTALLLVGLALLRIVGPRGPLRVGSWRVVLAGALLGACITLKIWGVVPVLVVLGGLVLQRRSGDAGRVLAGAVGACVLVCLPFSAAAPATMFRMVVLDQLGRRPIPVTWAERLTELLGLRLWGLELPVGVLVAVGVVVAAGTVWSLTQPGLRQLGAQAVATTAVLLSTPSWFLHYAAFLAGPAALLLGACAGSAVAALARRHGRGPAGVLLGLLVVGVGVVGWPVTEARLLAPFPGPALTRVLADVGGCVAVDDPTTLVLTDTLRRNLDRGCRLEVDLGGASYDLGEPGGPEVSRARNRVWQAYCLAYYRGSAVVVSTRFGEGLGYSRASYRTLTSWPVLAEEDGIVVRVPRPAG